MKYQPFVRIKLSKKKGEINLKLNGLGGRQVKTTKRSSWVEKNGQIKFLWLNVMYLSQLGNWLLIWSYMQDSFLCSDCWCVWWVSWFCSPLQTKSFRQLVQLTEPKLTPPSILSFCWPLFCIKLKHILNNR